MIVCVPVHQQRLLGCVFILIVHVDTYHNCFWRIFRIEKLRTTRLHTQHVHRLINLSVLFRIPELSAVAVLEIGTDDVRILVSIPRVCEYLSPKCSRDLVELLHFSFWFKLASFRVCKPLSDPWVRWVQKWILHQLKLTNTASFKVTRHASAPSFTVASKPYQPRTSVCTRRSLASAVDHK